MPLWSDKNITKDNWPSRQSAAAQLNKFWTDCEKLFCDDTRPNDILILMQRQICLP